MNCAFYILHSAAAHKFYFGHTTELIETRLRKHNTNHGGFTSKFQDWKLVHVEPFETKKEAYARERQVKAWKSKIKIEFLISNKNIPQSKT
ncbi:MAG: GIY-YIG nuclease family protein [Chryseolinea sp.]